MPSNERRMIAAWAQLMGLSLAMALLAEAGFGLAPRAVLLVLLGIVVVLKARIILRDYLALRDHASATSAFLVPIALLMAVIAASFLLIRAPPGS